MNLADEFCLRPEPNLSSVIAREQHPISVFQRLAKAEGYDHERVQDNELHLSVPGLWCNHDIVISFDPASEKISLILTFDSHTPGGRRDDICRLLALINERLVAGHFEFWGENGTLVYRDSHTLRGGARLLVPQAQDMVALALDAAERGYPAAQYVIWAGKSPEDALTSALVDLAAHP